MNIQQSSINHPRYGIITRMDEPKNRLVTPEPQPEDHLDQSLRPRLLKNLIGQERVKENLSILIAASKQRGEPLDHVLFYGPPGLGKTTLSYTLANEMGVNIKITAGPAIEKRRRPGRHPDQPASRGCAVHRRGAPARQGGGGSALPGDGGFRPGYHHRQGAFGALDPPEAAAFYRDRSHHPPGAAHRPAARPLRGGLPPGLLRSGGDAGHRRPGGARVLGVKAEAEGVDEIARRGRGTPRVALRLLRRVRDYAQVRGDGVITRPIAQQALDLLNVDPLGLDEMDRRVLSTIIEKYHGGPVGLNTIAASISEEPDTIMDVVEPYLLQLGFLERTSQGRVATQLAYEHLGLAYPKETRAQLPLNFNNFEAEEEKD